MHLFTDSADIQQLSLPNGCTGSAVLDVLEDLILVVGVSLIRPDQLFIGRVDWANLKSAIEWKRLTSGNELPTEHSLSSDLLSFKTPDAMEFEVIFLFDVIRILKYLKQFSSIGNVSLSEGSIF